MNLPASLRPDHSRSVRLPVAAAVSVEDSQAAAANSFSLVLDGAVSPARDRAFARLRNPRDRSAEGGDGGEPRLELKPNHEARKKARAELPEPLAGAYAYAMTAAPLQIGEQAHSQGRPRLGAPPTAMGETPGGLADPASSAASAPFVPLPPGGAGAAGNAEAIVPGAPEPAAKPERSIVAQPEANRSADPDRELVAASQTLPEDSTQDCPIPAAAGSAALQKELFAEIKNSGGIAAAKLDEQMKNTETQDEVAGSPKQILPGAQAVELPPFRATARREGGRSVGASASLEVFVGAASAKDAGPTVSPELPPGSDLLSGPLSPVDRMAKVISREVQIFQRTADQAMEVILTPDQHTQISLRLQWREGKVEVLARCAQGDYHALNTQWPLLQSALEQQGVRLSQLTPPAHSGYTEFFNSAGFAQSHHNGHRQPGPKVAADPLPPVAEREPSGKTPPSYAARGRHLLESWA